MIIKFTIENYRSIKEPLTIDFNASSIKEHEEDNLIHFNNAKFLKSIAILALSSALFIGCKDAPSKTAEVKGKKSLYKNTHWDVVDAVEQDLKFLDKVDLKTLPDSLQNKSRDDLKKIVIAKKVQRDSNQTEIGKLSAQRETFIKVEKAKKTSATVATLETEIEKIVRKQAAIYKMIIP